MKEGKLILVGAGPGDPDLITVKAIKALNAADVVLYDALIDNQLLEHSPDAEKIFVGKRKGCSHYLQQQINELIVQRWQQGQTIVRLKGGDPFVFGRGAEEMEFAAQHGLAVEMVPGISSSMAVPALSNVPLTKRGSSQSFWVITGTTKDHGISEDVYLAAKSNATVVILMGMSKLGSILQIFKEAGKNELPAAIIQNGTTANERSVFGKVSDLEMKSAAKGLSNPAIIILGEVVRHREKMAQIQERLNYV